MLAKGVFSLLYLVFGNLVGGNLLTALLNVSPVSQYKYLAISKREIWITKFMSPPSSFINPLEIFRILYLLIISNTLKCTFTKANNNTCFSFSKPFILIGTKLKNLLNFNYSCAIPIVTAFLVCFS